MSTLDYEASSAAYRQVSSLSRTPHSHWAHAQALVGLGNSARGLGNRDAASRVLQEAYETAERDGVRSVMANSLTSLAMLDYDAGRMQIGTERLRRAVDLLLEIGDGVEAARALALLSHTLAGLGEYDDAFANARRAIDTLKVLGEEMVLLTAEIAYANCFFEIGRYREAISRYDQCIATARRHENTHREAVSLMNKLQAHIELGEFEAAQNVVDSLERKRNRINHRLLGSITFEQGLLAESQGQICQARSCISNQPPTAKSTGKTGSGSTASPGSCAWR